MRKPRGECTSDGRRFFRPLRGLAGFDARDHPSEDGCYILSRVLRTLQTPCSARIVATFGLGHTAFAAMSACAARPAACVARDQSVAPVFRRGVSRASDDAEPA